MNVNGAEDIVEELRNNPDRVHWEQFIGLMKKDNAAYYKIIFSGDLNVKADLKDGSIIIYDNEYERLYSVPLVIKENGRYEGSTILIKDLEINRREFEEQQ